MDRTQSTYYFQKKQDATTSSVLLFEVLGILFKGHNTKDWK